MMKEVDHGMIGEQHRRQQTQPGILSVKPVIVCIKDELIEIEEAKEMFLRYRRTDGHRVELIRGPHHDDHMKGNR